MGWWADREGVGGRGGGNRYGVGGRVKRRGKRKRVGGWVREAVTRKGVRGVGGSEVQEGAVKCTRGNV